MNLRFGPVFTAAFMAAALMISLFPPRLAVRAVRPYAVTDLTGQNVELPGPAKSAVIYTPTVWHYVTVDQTSQNIQAMAAFMTNEIRGNLLDRIFPGLTRKEPALGDTVAVARPLSSELILLARPDVIMGWAHFSGELAYVKYPGLIQIPASYSLEAMYLLLGRLTGKSLRVDYLYRRQSQRFCELNAGFSPKPDKPLTAVAFSARQTVMGKEFTVFNRNLKRAGLINAAGDLGIRPGPLSPEILLELNPDIIFLNYLNRSVRVNDFYRQPALQGLSAVRNKRIYRLPRGAARMEGPVEEPILTAWLTVLAYPDLTGRMSLRGEIKNTYREFYGYEMSEDEIDDFLELGENALSADYGRFVRKAD
jgi:iron complex transport system substrate-binding protein